MAHDVSTDSNSSIDETAKAGVEATDADAAVPNDAASAEVENVTATGEAETAEPENAADDTTAEEKQVNEGKALSEKVGGDSGAKAPATTADEDDEETIKRWYILKVQVNREDSIRDALQRRVKIEGLDEYFGDIVVPTEDVAEFTKSGKRRIVKKKLYPGYIMVHMVINDDTWFAVRETPGIGDFTGSAGKPTPMEQSEVERILNLGDTEEDGDSQIKTSIPYSPGDRVRVKEGYFQNFEGEVDTVDEANGRVTVMINIFGRSTPVELEHWQIESV